MAENVPWLDLGNSSMGVYVELCVQLRPRYIAVYKLSLNKEKNIATYTAIFRDKRVF